MTSPIFANLPTGSYWVRNGSEYLVVKAMSTEDARNRILEAGAKGRTFYVHFIKRSTGEERKMICRLGVTKGVKGVLKPGERKAQDERCESITVYEMGVGFKRIPLDAVIEVRGQISTLS